MSTDTTTPRPSITLSPDTKAMSLIPSSFNDILFLSKVLATSSLIPSHLRNKPDDVAIIIATGLEFGFSPFVSLRQVYVVEGKPALSADAQLAVVLRSSVCEYFRLVESTPQKATYETKRRGWPEPSHLTYTIEDAKNAGLANKPNWKLNPLKMLQNRAKSTLAGAVYSDLLLGMPSVEDAAEQAGFESARDVTPTAAPESAARVLGAIQAMPEAQEGADAVVVESADASAPDAAEPISSEARARIEELKAIGSADALARWRKRREASINELAPHEQDAIAAVYQQRVTELS